MVRKGRGLFLVRRKDNKIFFQAYFFPSFQSFYWITRSQEMLMDFLEQGVFLFSHPNNILLSVMEENHHFSDFIIKTVAIFFKDE